MMNPQKIMAPATEITNSMASLQKNIWEGGRRKGGWEEGREGEREERDKWRVFIINQSCSGSGVP